MERNRQGLGGQPNLVTKSASLVEDEEHRFILCSKQRSASRHVSMSGSLIDVGLTVSRSLPSTSLLALIHIAGDGSTTLGARKVTMNIPQPDMDKNSTTQLHGLRIRP